MWEWLIQNWIVLVIMAIVVVSATVAIGSLLDDFSGMVKDDLKKQRDTK